MLEKAERENKNYRSVPFPSYPMCNRKFQKNIAKKLKKLKNTIKNSFQAKIGWKKMRKRNKNYRSNPFRSVPTRCVIENSIKIVKN